MMRVEQGGGGRTNLEVNRLQFIIKYVADSFSDYMVFPQKIGRNLKEMAKLDKKIYLVGPSGNRWPVKLLKRGHFYLEDGWKDFIEDHNVIEDDCLIFKYCGNSCFTVLIFDKSGCEKESSYVVKNGRSPASNKQLQAHQSQSSEDNVCSFTKLENHNDPKLSSDDGSSSGCFYNSEISRSKRKTWHDQSLKSPKYDSKFSSSLKVKTEKLEMKIKSSRAEIRAQRLVKSISKRNPCFIKVLTPSSCSAKYDLIIPRDFVMNCKLLKEQLTIIRIPRKKDWEVRYEFKNSCWCLLWRNFVKDNSLKEGDACAFELTDYRPKMVIVVHIFRAS